MLDTAAFGQLWTHQHSVNCGHTSIRLTVDTPTFG